MEDSGAVLEEDGLVEELSNDSEAEVEDPLEEDAGVPKFASDLEFEDLDTGIRSRLPRIFNKENTFSTNPQPLPNLGIVDPTFLLNHLLETAVEIEAFKSLVEALGKSEIQSILERGSNQVARQLCIDGLIDLEHLKTISEGAEDPAKPSQPGVYLHLLYLESVPNAFWLYVGQSVCLKDRIRKHHTRRLQSSHYCLHYHIWNSSKQMKSSFMTFFELFRPDTTHQQRQLILNLAEMWFCCIFQTLTCPSLEKYLPDTLAKPWAGRHLNIAVPLYQSFSPAENPEIETLGDREGFTQFLTSTDPQVRKWAISLRSAFNSLANSPDARARAYYRQLIAISTSKARDACQANRIKKMQRYLSGEDIKVTVETYRDGAQEEYTKATVACGQFVFTIPSSLGFWNNDRVFVKLDLRESEHANKYTTHSRPDDPASRLGVSIVWDDGERQMWLKASRRNLKHIKRINTLVDILEGFPYQQRRALALPRRWYKENQKHYYT
ncbi:uncharacterized protein BJX67DRAFT_379608 [Aspergillus lucknowensis]|uniref:GIY-YIG domain-containing protein n=1 Tax=Aspergillus lucknowensis TaxID=176173 RepID=A0ABR4LX67_9EURO